jgi:Fatty acid desaturase
MGWLFSSRHYGDVRQEFAPHLLQDRTVRFVSKYSLLWGALGLLIPYLIGGFTGFIWGGLVRVFLVNHVTYSVNSICHVFGNRPFETTDESRNHWLIGLLAFGEGWHNNHHAFPNSAVQGFHWWQFDGSGLIIRTLKRLGLVWDVQTVEEETARMKKEQGVQKVAAHKQAFDELIVKLQNARSELSRMQSESADAMKGKYRDAMTRLSEIQEHATRATHLKVQRLKQYGDEAALVVARCKAAVQPA